VKDDDRVAARPRGRPKAEDSAAPLEKVLAAAATEFSVTGYHGLSMRTLNRKLGVSHNHLYQRFGSKDALWRATVDWAFSPLVQAIEAADRPDAAPEVRVRTFIRAFLEHSASRPYLARIVTMESATASERLDYLYDQFIDPIRSRFVPILQGMRRSSKSNADVMEVVYYLITAGGTAPFEQVPMSARMGVHFDPADVEAVRVRADLVCDIILNGIV